MSAPHDDARQRVRKVLMLSAFGMFGIAIALMATTDNALTAWIIAGFGVLDLILAVVVPQRMARPRTPEQQLADLEQRYGTGEVSAEAYEAERARILGEG